eukprot:scaffold137954_cov31-Tisochrysis_lutea.AAC.5
MGGSPAAAVWATDGRRGECAAGAHLPMKPQLFKIGNKGPLDLDRHRDNTIAGPCGRGNAARGR